MFEAAPDIQTVYIIGENNKLVQHKIYQFGAFIEFMDLSMQLWLQPSPEYTAMAS